MKRIVINGDEFKNEKELHEILIERLELPDYYGKNLDALWDCLTGWIDLPAELIWTNFPRSEEVLGERAKRFLQLFIEAEYELGGQFKFIYE